MVIGALADGTESVRKDPSEENYRQQEANIERAARDTLGWTGVIVVLVLCVFVWWVASVISASHQTAISTNSGPTESVALAIPENVMPTPSQTMLPSPTSRPTFTPMPSSTPTPSPVYICPDFSDVRLRIGAVAEVVWEKVNLRSYPRVPDQWDANIIVALDKGTQVKVIGGPECEHDGTWWKVRTQSGDVGWMRELLPDKRLLKPIY